MKHIVVTLLSLGIVANGEMWNIPSISTYIETLKPVVCPPHHALCRSDALFDGTTLFFQVGSFSHPERMRALLVCNTLSCDRISASRVPTVFSCQTYAVVLSYCSATQCCRQGFCAMANATISCAFKSTSFIFEKVYVKNKKTSPGSSYAPFRASAAQRCCVEGQWCSQTTNLRCSCSTLLYLIPICQKNV